MFAMQGGGFLFLAVVVVLGPQAEGQPTANTEQACGRGRVDGSYMGVQGLSGNISSPNYPNMYPGNINCAWRIMVDEGQRIVIVFKALDIEDHGQCSYDYLRIRDGAGTTAASLAKVCGHTLPPSVTSSGNNVLIIFRSDYSVGGEGFDIEWSAEDLPGLISNTSCEREGGRYMGVQGLSGNISSPNYPNMYPKNSNCAWRIMVDEGKRIVIVFKALDIEDHGACSYDYLRIHDGAKSTAASLAMVCGHRLPPSVTSSENNVFLIFRSVW
ncbi:CUB domain-containing protein 2-like isoform X1 [Branchiostoma lanceolatum]|uniref:CUB domain-containing protein 2-like isoform X1 n=1 Tax=Branchiostoma lanceolatum TaxID=7740 RepID=UPI0034561513